MNLHKSLLICLLLASVSLASFALPPGEQAEYDDNPMGTAVFDGETHKNMGLKCKDCHSDAVDEIPERTRTSFADHHEEKSCFACHEVSFENEGNCATCHNM